MPMQRAVTTLLLPSFLLYLLLLNLLYLCHACLNSSRFFLGSVLCVVRGVLDVTVYVRV